MAFMNRLSGLFHKKIYLLWNGPKSPFLRMVQNVSYKVIFEAAPVANFPLPSFRLHRCTNLDRVFAP